MSTLILTVLRCPDAAAAEQRQVTGGEFTLGRGAECDWTLPDPLKSLSRRHCTLAFRSGQWLVQDQSSNGTFLNFETTPIGRDASRPLQDGDRLRLGDYEIEARLDESAHTLPAPLSPAWSPAQMLGAGSSGATGSSGGFGGARLPGLDDPLPAGGMSLGGFGPPTAPPTATADHGPASHDAFSPPSASGSAQPMIPEDWYSASEPDAGARPLDAAPAWPPAPAVTERPADPTPSFAAPFSSPFSSPLPEPAPSEPLVQEAARAAELPIAAPLSLPASPVAGLPTTLASSGQPGGANSGGDWSKALAALMAGGDLAPELAVRATADPQLSLRNAGALLRAAVTGLRALLIARGSVKREFRIEQTMLRPADNNPLKFAASNEQALAALLDPRTPALQAVQESIDDLTLHQVATLAATQAAARALLERLAPTALEAEDSGGGLLPGAREKRLWEAYKRRHAALLAQFEDDFDSAFGTAFARAYEQAASRQRDGS